MKLIIGLGNPGKKYSGNRHNVGFMALDSFAQELGIESYELRKKFQSLLLKTNDLIIARPQTMMNESGRAVKKLVDHYKLKSSDLWVIHDDLDLPLGSYKIQKGKGPKEHKGLLSVYESLGNKDFWHVRIGIENRIKNQESRIRSHISGEQYVLQDFTDEEMVVIKEVIAKIVKDLSSLYTDL